ncbi:MAG: DUF3857 domain-containing protein, partial [Lewinella sp.]|nr:DUF3857 domain-containing protein [Lewinella sp.]
MTSLADRQMTRYEPDTSAIAVVLDEAGTMTIHQNSRGNYYILTVHRRIKILQPRGIDAYGDASVTYVHEDGLSRVYDLRAQTISPNGEIDVVDPEAGIFQERIDDRYSRYVFSFPNVRVGSIIEYTYQMEVYNIFSPRPWKFRSTIPIRRSYFEFTNESRYTFSYFVQGLDYLSLASTEGDRQTYALDEMRFSVEGTRFRMERAAALRKEPFITALDDYTLRLQFQLSEDPLWAGTTFYDSWGKAAETLFDHRDFGKQYQQRSRHRDLVEAADAVISADAPPAERLVLAHRFLTQQVRWTGYEGLLTEEDLDKAFGRGQAKLAELQLMGVALLRHLGFQAHPALTSTRDHGAIITDYPFMNQFNYLFVAVELGPDQWQLVDFTDPLIFPGLIRESALNQLAFVIKDGEARWLQLNAPTAPSVLAVTGQLSATGELRGELTATRYSYDALADRRRQAGHELQATWQDRLPDDLSLTDFEITTAIDDPGPVQVKAGFSAPSYALRNGDFLYLSPSLFFTWDR